MKLNSLAFPGLLFSQVKARALSAPKSLDQYCKSPVGKFAIEISFMIHSLRANSESYTHTHTQTFYYRIFVGGHSAGAHLAACMLVTDWLQYGMKTPAPFAGAVLLSGIYDLAPIQKTYVNDPIQLTE